MATRTTKTTSKSASTAATAKPKSTAKPKAVTKATAATTKTTTTKTTAPVVVDAPTPVVAGPMMRKKELIDTVVMRSGLKKKDVKPTVEATLAVLGEALQSGRSLNLNPMGKVKVKREKKFASGRMLVARIRQNAHSGVSTDNDASAPASTPDAAPGSDKTAAE